MIRPLLTSLALICLAPAVMAQSGGAKGTYIDDDRFMKSLERAMLKLAEDGKAARGKELLSQMSRKSCDIPPAPASGAVLAPEEIYTGCSGGVVAITSAWKSEDGKGWEAGEPATAWVMTPDGVLVTNYHVFSDAEKDEVFGVMTRDGAFYPVLEILAADSLNDVAIFRIPARGLQPLALAVDEPVGKKVCVISHPDQQFYTFTQGQISRYTVQRDDAKSPGVNYMCITADYAKGSSGGPVLNEHGAVIGMVCSTRTTYYGERNKDPDDDVQMVVKFCIPGESIRNLLRKTPALRAQPDGNKAPEAPKAETVPERSDAPVVESEPPPAPKAEPVPE